jgi:transposase
MGTRKIAQMLGLGRKQVRNALPPAPRWTPHATSASPPTSLLDPFRTAIDEKVQAGLTTTRILREIRSQGYQGGRSILAAYVAKVRAPLRPKKKVRRRFETGPGKEMQVDWSTYRVPLAGKLRWVHAFVAVLAYSRKAFVHFFFNQRQSTLLEAHVLAFTDFEGLCARIVYDRMATVVLGTIGKERKPLWHPRFLDFCRHYGYEPFLCKVADPDRKGEVENFFYYLERDFVRGSSFESLEHMNRAVRIWLDEVANPRLHATIRRIPQELWSEEKPFLIELPHRLFPVFEEEIRQVGADATISISGTPYTVLARLAHHKVMVRLYAEHFEVLDARGELAMTREYVCESDKGRLQIDPLHYEDVRPRSPIPGGSLAQMEERFLQRFSQLAELLAGIKQRMKSLFHIHLRALWRSCEQWGEELFVPAALRAQGYRRYDAHAVRRILEREHPLPEEDPVTPLGAKARALCELGEVESGSLEDYAHLDAHVPKEPGAQEGEEEDDDDNVQNLVCV